MHAPVDAPPRDSPPARNGALAAGDGPRERLDALGAEALSEAELIALLLRTGGGGRDALALAAWLLQQHQGLSGLATIERMELAAHAGRGAGQERDAGSGTRARAPARRAALASGRPGARSRRRVPALPRAAASCASRAIPGRPARRASPDDARGGDLAGDAHREPRASARGVSARAARGGGRRRAGPQPPERRSDAQHRGSRDHIATRRCGFAARDPGPRSRRRRGAGLGEPLRSRRAAPAGTG